MSKNNNVGSLPLSTTVVTRFLSLLGLVLAFAAPCARAVPLPTGDTALSGTTLAQRPELAYEVVEDHLIPYSFQGAGSSVSGVIQNRVFRSVVDGTLNFYWRIIPDASSTGDITAFRVGGFGGFTLDGDFHLDSPGSVGPDTARNFGDGSVNFLFSDGVSPGESSFFFFLDTQATDFSNTGSYDLLCADNGCISPPFTTFAPAPPTPSSGVRGTVLGVDSGANDGSSTLLQISSETAAGTVIGETGFTVTDIAVTPDGRVFGITHDSLLSINPTMGIASPVGTGLGVSDANALVSDTNGVLYGATDSGSFIRIDPQTGLATVIGSYGSGLASSGDLAFSPNGQLFGTVLDGGADDVLISVDLATGQATVIGRIGFPAVWGLAFAPDGTLFGATSVNPPSLLVIDITTGAGTAVGTIIERCINRITLLYV